MKFFIVLGFIVVSRQCAGRAVDDGLLKESVVSVYTTQPTTAGGSTSLDVYHQIASNIAERITSPIYRFFGIGTNTTEVDKTTKRPWDKIELLDDIPELDKPEIQPVNNDISHREVEELSIMVANKTEKRPEKITLYSSYLPSQHLEDNDTDINSDEDFGFDFDDERATGSREGPFVYVLELFSSFVQLVWAGLSSLLKF